MFVQNFINRLELYNYIDLKGINEKIICLLCSSKMYILYLLYISYFIFHLYLKLIFRT